MKYRVVLFLMAWMLLFAIQAQQITRIESSPYPVATEKPDKLYLTSESFTYSQKLTIQSLQGMLARTKPEILRDTHNHASLLNDLVKIDRTYYSNFNGLLALYANRFDGYILCEPKTASVNVAFSLCPILNAILIPADIEQSAINAGYSKVLDVRDKDESWVLQNYGNQLSKSIVSYQAFNDDRALFLGDYSVFAGALQFWDSSATGSLAKSVYSRMNPLSVYFGWGAGEFNTVEQISQYSAMIHPSDWSPNLSALSNIPVKMPRQKFLPADFKVVPDVHTVCFVISDGDNIQWLSGSLANKGNWDNPDKIRSKLGWTISPAYAELAPASYRKYVENALVTENARNVLMAGPSGTGYFFPSIYPQLSAQNKLNNEMMEKADLSIVNIIDKDGNHNPNDYLAQSNVDALFYYSYGGQYTKLAGEIKWYKDKPSIGGRFTLWGNTDDGSAATRNKVAQNLANTLNKQSTDIYSANGYSLIPVHIWTMNPSDVLNCISKLNPNVRVVDPEEFVWLIRKNLKNLNLANGNGLRAEYTLDSRPEQPVLVTNERTAEYHDDYLTEGTQAVGSNAFTATWSGKIQPIYSQTYTFHSTAKGGVFLKINGRVLCDSLENSSVTSADTITLASGEKYDIEFKFKKNALQAVAKLEWESRSQVRQRIPYYQLFSQPLSTTGNITAFSSNDFAGYSSALKLGDYNKSALESKGFETFDINALKIAEGFKVVLYSEDNFQGDSIVLTSDKANLTEWGKIPLSLKVKSNGIDLAEGTYFIKLANNVMGVEGGYTAVANGKKIKLFRNTGAISMQFRFEKTSDKVYRIVSVSSDKSLEIESFSQENRANLQQWTNSDADNQKFIIIPTADEGVYKIMSCNSGKVLEANSTSSTAQIFQSDNQNQNLAKWQLEPVPPLVKGKGNGLTADYFNGKEFNTWRATELDTTINFSWGTGKPHRLVNADNFSVRWQGKIQPRFTGTYTFFVNSDNGRRLWVNNNLIIDKWLDDYNIEYSGDINLQENQYYDIKLEYFESTGGASCYLEWLSPNQPREIVPKSQLFSLDYDFSAVNNVRSVSMFKAYPNPVSGNIINIQFYEDLIGDKTTLNIFDATSRQVVTADLADKTTQLDISNLQRGIYFISIIYNNNNYIQKFIKN
ncbi:hypothetical protein MASR2M117_07840 [Paludibacter sp.]